jgi:benzoyl-CoA reductase subunit C
MNIRELHENRSDIVREYKRGKSCPAIGTFCSYAPVEIISSFGIVPVRIWGESENLSRADSLLQTFICPPVRHMMALGLEGSYDYLDGIVHCYTCDATCGLYNIWVKNLKPAFSHMMSLPYADTGEALLYARAEFDGLIRKLESFTGKLYSPQNLEKSIALYGEARSLMKEIYFLKKRDFPVTYSDICAMNIGSLTIPVEIFIPELRRFAEGIRGKTPGSRKKTRVLLSGSFLSCSAVVDFMEEIGGDIVADDTCMGLRALGDMIHDGDPLASLSLYYLKFPKCSSRADFPARKTFLLETIREFEVNAVVFIHQKFCDPHLSDYPYLKKILEENKIPHLQFETEGDGFTAGNRTRIETFFEMLERR